MTKTVALVLYLLLGFPILDGRASVSENISVNRVIIENDNPDLLDNGMTIQRNLWELARTVPSEGMLSVHPWSDGRWSLDSGLLARRYADVEFEKASDLRSKYEYVSEIEPYAKLIEEPDESKRLAGLDSLSPAEKYDLIVGDPEFSLTHAQWSEGLGYLERRELASWMGICEGSAAASVLVAEPQHVVELQAPNGLMVRFYPLEIKGLASLLWSSYNVTAPTLGTRCHIGNPSMDRNGVVTDLDCFNPNPASFHLAILNWIGQMKRPLFMNRSLKLEVWNVPVVGYRVTYGNSRRVSNMPQDVLLRFARMFRDRWTPYRSVGTTWIVGVNMSVWVASGFSHNREESTQLPLKELNYRYDLEIRSDGTVLGGEWHQEQHPDLLWAIRQGARPTSLGDRLLGGQVVWEGEPLSGAWLSAIQMSSRKNQPLELIVQKLVDLSRR